MNAFAWETFHAVLCRFGVDGQAVGQALGWFTADLTDEEKQDLWHRLSLLYDELVPRPAPPKAD